jgi:hypothetical protein
MAMVVQWQGQHDNATPATDLGSAVPGVFDTGGVRPGSFGNEDEIRNFAYGYVRPDPDSSGDDDASDDGDNG